MTDSPTGRRRTRRCAGHQVVGGHRGLRLGLFRAGGVEQDAALGVLVRIIDVDLHQKAVELGLGEGIGAFLLQRVLRRQHMERLWQIVARTRDRDVLFLHRLQQRRLRTRRGAVDFVGHQKLCEHRSGEKAKAAFAASALFQHFGAENVGRHQVRRELHAPCVEAEHRTHVFHELGLGEAGDADQQRVAAGQNGNQCVLDHVFLAENHGPDGGLGSLRMTGGGFGRPHDHVFHLLDAFTACGHACSLCAFAPLNMHSSYQPPAESKGWHTLKP